MPDRRRRLLVLGGALAALPAFGQQKVPRIGYLLLAPISDSPSRERQAFLDGLRELGYVPGRNVELIYRSAESEPEFLDEVCQDLLRQKVDVIVVSGAIATLAAKRATRSVPIVIQAVGDPVGIGAVRSLSRPEGNVTGISFISSELAGKRVELIRELVPAAKQVAVLWDKRNANARAEAEATQEAARHLGLASAPLALGSDAELRLAFERLRSRRPHALYVSFEGGLVASNRSSIAQFGLSERIPVVSGWSFLTEAGGLASYAPDIPSMFRRSASYVDRLLKGARPADLPIEQASTIELVVNARSARALGLKIPPAILARADRVIE